MWHILLWFIFAVIIQAVLAIYIFQRQKNKIPRTYILLTMAYFTVITLAEKILLKLKLEEKIKQLRTGTYEHENGLQGIRILRNEIIIDATFIGLALTALLGFIFFHNRKNLRKDFIVAFGYSLLLGIPLGLLRWLTM